MVIIVMVNLMAGSSKGGRSRQNWDRAEPGCGGGVGDKGSRGGGRGHGYAGGYGSFLGCRPRITICSYSGRRGFNPGSCKANSFCRSGDDGCDFGKVDVGFSII